MSVKHPVIAITGSSGAGTTSVTRTFQHIFRREKLDAAIVEGDAFHRFDRTAMKAAMAAAAQSGNNLNQNDQVVLNGHLIVAQGETVGSAVLFHGTATAQS